MNGLVVLVFGGRDYGNQSRVESLLRDRFADCTLDGPHVVIHGGCSTGADKFASIWCRFQTDIQEVCCNAAWTSLLGRAAGPQRNTRMLDIAVDLSSFGERLNVIAFPGGSGTADMLRKVKKLREHKPCISLTEVLDGRII